MGEVAISPVAVARAIEQPVEVDINDAQRSAPTIPPGELDDELRRHRLARTHG